MGTIRREGSNQSFYLILITSLLLGCLVSWSGLPPERSRQTFLIGVFILIGVMALFATATWHLLWRPLPKGHAVSSTATLSPFQNQVLGALVLIAMLNIIIGGLWDEVWHREYGVPFGEDLLWRPHLMLYTGFGLVTLLAFGGIWFSVRNGRGTLQQRFRSNRALGMLTMLGGFLLFALPADPIWHLVYGEDITAWSLPHLLLLVSTISIGVLAMALLMSAGQKRQWRHLFDQSLETPLLLVAASGILTVMVIVLLTEWDFGFGDPASHFRSLGRPDWLLPVMATCVGTWVGTVSLHATRRFGAATVVGLLALLIRALFVSIVTAPDITLSGWLIVFPALVACDIAYALRGADTLPPSFLSMAFWMLLSSGITVVLVGQLYAYPVIVPSMALPIVASVLLMALVLTWLGRVVGDFICAQSVLDSAEINPEPTRLRLVVPTALASVITFIVVFVLTATPPV